ncbi:unnamed protein product [Acanthoscelides obtectus]|uniref:Uncharacterized protein n=1 Tax=Acanthoscelides obtectus TaxID=200917 RepID=A0A9P0P747_ACAOB|nr:unnamed protein product [Acanthoscelides obtectus]CAK1655995.1 hypothetical protein AOBTE_LOCUS19497 [Acanthoscelides obtectus]
MEQFYLTLNYEGVNYEVCVKDLEMANLLLNGCKHKVTPLNLEDSMDIDETSGSVKNEIEEQQPDHTDSEETQLGPSTTPVSRFKKNSKGRHCQCVELNPSIKKGTIPFVIANKPCVNGYLSVSRVIVRVSHAIAKLYPRYVRMPEDLLDEQVKFYNISRLPRIVCVNDGTHIKIKNPGGVDGEIFRNPKGFFLLNVQVMCDLDMKFTDVVAK